VQRSDQEERCANEEHLLAFYHVGWLVCHRCSRFRSVFLPSRCGAFSKGFPLVLDCSLFCSPVPKIRSRSCWLAYAVVRAKVGPRHVLPHQVYTNDRCSDTVLALRIQTHVALSSLTLLAPDRNTSSRSLAPSSGSNSPMALTRRAVASLQSSSASPTALAQPSRS
jgi:hypothetical protein